MNTSENQTVEMEPAEELAEPPSGSIRRSPGAMLAAQRETLELSIQQVADQLNLTMHFVRALEADCYDKLPGEVFVRGYIRAYSNLLRLDPVQLLLIFDEFTSQKIARKEEAIKRRDRRRKDKNRPWILFSGFAFVAVAVALWYLNPAVPAVNIAADPVLMTEPETSVLAAVPLDTPLSLSTQSAVLADESIAEDAVLLPDLAELEMADAVLSDVASESEDFGQASIIGLETEDTVSTRTVSYSWTGADELTLHFSADCWVEIEHRGGDESYKNASSAGDAVVIKGTAPFSVLLGNARDVKVTFNGRSMDISSNIRADNTARLSIGM